MGDVSLMWGPAVTGIPQHPDTPEATWAVERSAAAAAAVTGMPQQPATPVATVVVEGSTLVAPRAAKGHTGAVC